MTNHPRFSNLGEWISFEYGDQGALAEALKPKVAKNTVSSWKTGKNGIPGEYQKQIRKLGYDGPWPRESGNRPAVDAETGISARSARRSVSEGGTKPLTEEALPRQDRSPVAGAGRSPTPDAFPLPTGSPSYGRIPS